MRNNLFIIILLILNGQFQLSIAQTKSDGGLDFSDKNDWTTDTYFEMCQSLEWMINHEPSNRGNSDDNINSYNFIKWTTIAIEKFPQKAYGYFLRAKAKFLLDDNRGGLSDMQTSIKLNPSRGEAHFWVASKKIIIDRNDYSSALQYINTAIKLLTEEKDTYFLGEAYITRGMIKIISLKDKNGGCLDLSKSGEIGSTRVYTLISKYCG